VREIEEREEAIIGKWRNHFVLHKKEREVDHRKKSFSSSYGVSVEYSAIM